MSISAPPQPKDKPKPTGNNPDAALVRDPDAKAFRPFGSAYDVLYKKNKILGVSGPAGTGKSRACLEKAHIICEKYAGARVLIARKTRESLTEAALFTYEAKVLPVGHPVAADSIRRSHRQQYAYPNGSLIVVAGLDKPQKIMSTEYDFIYVQEAIECEEADFEMLTTRLRNAVVPYQQLLFDCNPDVDTHWIWQGSLMGRWPLIQSSHEDNPTLWQEAPPNIKHVTPEWPQKAPDGRIGRYTLFGESYLGTLDALTGPRHLRLRRGLWVGAEGAIYDIFDQMVHCWSDGDGKAPWGADPFPPRSWRRTWIIDFGFTVPFVCQKWAHAPDGRMWCYQEIYRTRCTVQTHAKRILETSGWSYTREGGHMAITAFPDPLPSNIIADHDAEGRQTFEDESGLLTIPAIKNINGGIQAVMERLKPDWCPDGPGIMFRRDAVVDVDLDLARANLPTSTSAEFPGYVWDVSPGKKKGDIPLGKNDHGCDATRYLVAFEDGIRDQDVKAVDVAQMFATLGQTVVGVTPRQVVRAGFSGVRRSGIARGRRAAEAAARPSGQARPRAAGWGEW